VILPEAITKKAEKPAAEEAEAEATEAE